MTELTGDEQRAWRAFAMAARLLTDRLDDELSSRAGISPTYYDLLELLADAPNGTLRMNELACGSTSKPSRISHAVGRLEQAGWVERTHCETDRRGWLATLTEEGRAVLRNARGPRSESIRTHLLDLLTPQQTAQLGEIGEALLAHLRPSRATVPASPGSGATDPGPARPPRA